MAMVNVGRWFVGDPNIWYFTSQLSGNAQMQLNATGDRWGSVFSIPKSGTIDRVGVRTAACASAVLCRAGLYTVDGSGNPTSTGYGGSAFATYTPAANTWSEITLATPASATMGDNVALVVEFDSTAGNMFMSVGGLGGTPYNYPYSLKFTSAVWSKQTAATGPQLAGVRYNDGTWPRCIGPAISSVAASVAYNVNTGGGDEYGMQFSCNMTARVIGIWHMFRSAAGGDHVVSLYDGTTLIASATEDGDYMRAASANSIVETYFTAPVTITPSKTITASVRPTTATNVTGWNMVLPGVAQAETLGYPSEWSAQQASRVDLGTWSLTPGTVCAIGPIIDQIDNGLGSGGLLRGPGMGGGIYG